MMIIIESIWNAIIRSRYPSAKCWGYWTYKWDKNGNVRYSHLKTMYNYFTNNKQ